MREPDERPADRTLAIGRTGAGKSGWIRYRFRQIRSQKICIDVNNAESFPGVKPARDVADIDWSQPIIHYVPRDPSDQGEFEALYRQLFKRRGIAIWLDECYGVTTASSAPKHLVLVQTQGRKFDQRHLAATQRPVHINRNLIAQADHVLLFPKNGFSRKDLVWLGDELGIERDEIEQLIAQVTDVRRFGEYGHLHYERRVNHWHLRPSVPLL